MKADCITCIHEDKSPMSETCVSCGIAMKNYEPRTPPTNADRIRAMTDEELAAWREKCCPDRDNSAEDCWKESCELCWLDWLKEEVE